MTDKQEAAAKWLDEIHGIIGSAETITFENGRSLVQDSDSGWMVERCFPNELTENDKTMLDVLNQASDPDFTSSLLAAYAAEVEAGKWVDVNDGLPDKQGPYLVTVQFSDGIRVVAEAWFEFGNIGEGSWRNKNNREITNVTAYRPCPAPYAPA